MTMGQHLRQQGPNAPPPPCWRRRREASVMAAAPLQAHSQQRSQLSDSQACNNTTSAWRFARPTQAARVGACARWLGVAAQAAAFPGLQCCLSATILGLYKSLTCTRCHCCSDGREMGSNAAACQGQRPVMMAAAAAASQCKAPVQPGQPVVATLPLFTTAFKDDPYPRTAAPSSCASSGRP